MTKILFVCHGNICRSPMAEFIMKDIVRHAGLENMFEIASAATSSEEIGNDVYPPAKRKLQEKGIHFERRGARRITSHDYGYYDYIIGMDSANMRNMNRAFSGDPDGKLFSLLSFTDRSGDVADPWYTGDFEATWRDADEGCRCLLKYILDNAEGNH